jgi:Icc-related predicted phosphoesterase
MTLLIIADEFPYESAPTPGKADVLIACGDIPDQVILNTAKAAGCAAVLAVKGNHDFSSPFPAPIVDLHLRSHTHGGLRFGGFQGCWRYKPKGNYLYDQERVNRLLDSFAPVDIFVAHNSPRGVHDQDDDVHYGFDAFNAYIRRAHPRLLIHGHQHVNQETLVEGTRVVGVFGIQRVEV